MAPNLLIVEPDPVVAMDLSQILGGWLPQGVISVFSNLAEADVALKALIKPFLAVVNVAEHEIDAAMDRGLLVSLSDHVLLMVDTAEQIEPFPDNCILVQRPYTSDTLNHALIRVDASQY